jgi:hypothetical protein
LLQVIELFTPAGELFVELDALFLHGLMGVLRAAIQAKILSTHDSHVIVVVIQAKT